MILNLPSPPQMDVNRDYAGGYGTANLVRRKHYGHTGNTVFPVFMPYLATGLRRARYRFTVLDVQAERFDLEQTVSYVKMIEPQFIISMICLPSIYGDIRLLNIIKDKLPETTLIGVGTVARVMAQEILENSRLDFLIDAEYPFYSNAIVRLVSSLLGDPQRAASELPQVISKQGSNFEHYTVTSSLRVPDRDGNLDDLDLEVYCQFPMAKYKLCFSDVSGKVLNYFPILSSKGCPFDCVYCPYPVGFGRRISVKSPHKIVEEMEFLHKYFGIRAFVFRDQVFTANSSRVEEICDLISERHLCVNWLVETRADRISRHLLAKMKKAGCNRIHYGVETGDESMLRRIGKPGVDKAAMKEAFKNAADEGIYTTAHVILGLPGENKKTTINTYRFLLELNPDSVNWNIVTPYPGTQLFDLANNGDLILTYDWEKYNTVEVVMRTEDLSAKDLQRIARRFSRSFRARKVLRMLRLALRSRKCFYFLVSRIVHHVYLALSYHELTKKHTPKVGCDTIPSIELSRHGASL